MFVARLVCVDIQIQIDGVPGYQFIMFSRPYVYAKTHGAGMVPLYARVNEVLRSSWENSVW